MSRKARPRALTWILGALLATLAPMAAGTAHAAGPRVAVIAVDDASHRGFGGAVFKLLIKPLGADVELVPPSEVGHAVSRGRHDAAALHKPRFLVGLGRRLHASHVAVVDIRGRGRATRSHLLLVDVATGRIAMATQFTLPRGALNATIARRMATAIATKVGGAPAGRTNAAAEAALPQKPEVSAQTTVGTAEAGAAPAAGKKGEGFAFPGGTDKAAAAAPSQEPDQVSPDGAVPDEAGDSGHAAAAQVAQAGAEPSPLRRSARLALGLDFMQRTGHLNADPNEGYSTPCYCGTGSNANPLFPAFRLEAEIYPGGLVGDGNLPWWGNLGLGLTFAVAPVKSYTNVDPNSEIPNPATLVSSTVLDFRAQAMYRLRWWNDVLAPDNVVAFGVSTFSFPLHDAAFPGVTYTAPYVGLSVDVPVVANLMLAVEANYLFAIGAGGDAGSLLGHKTSGQAFNVGGGLRTGWDRYHLDVRAKYERYALTYAGGTSLMGTPAVAGGNVQWNDVHLADALLSIIAVAGVVF